MYSLTDTACCSLYQIQIDGYVLTKDAKLCGDQQSIADVKREILETIDQVKNSFAHGVFIITTPDEKELERVLITMRFNNTFSFKRRYGKGLLKMWTKQIR